MLSHSHRIKKIILKITLYILLLILLCCVYSGYKIARFAMDNTTQQGDTALVLGAATWDDQPSPVFKQRINHAIALYKQQQVSKIIFTGGKGDGKHYTESEVAAAYAIKHGVAANDIFLESESKTTIQNIKNSLSIIEAHKLNSILLVSDPLHMKRAMTIATDLGLKNIYSSPTTTSQYLSFYSKAQFLLREIYFYQRYWLFQI